MGVVPKMFGTIGSVVSSLYGFHLSLCQGKDRSHNVQVNRNLSASYLFILFFSFFDKCHSCFFSCSCKPLSQSKFTIILAREFPHKTPKLHKTCTCVNYSQCKQATHLFTFSVFKQHNNEASKTTLQTGATSSWNAIKKNCPIDTLCFVFALLFFFFLQ